MKTMAEQFAELPALEQVETFHRWAGRWSGLRAAKSIVNQAMDRAQSEDGHLVLLRVLDELKSALNGNEAMTEAMKSVDDAHAHLGESEARLAACRDLAITLREEAKERFGTTGGLIREHCAERLEKALGGEKGATSDGK